MLRSYFLVAIRNLVRNKIHTTINVLGLSVGLCVTLLILLFVKNELSYENFQTYKDDIYRLSITTKKDGKVAGETVQFVDALGPAVKNKYPEVEDFTRVSVEYTAPVKYQNKSVRISKLRYADSTFFDVFDYELKYGDKKSVLANPFSVLLSETTSRKIFGESECIGKTVEIEKKPYLITGIIKDAPNNTHLQYDAIASFNTLYSLPKRYMGWRGGNQYISYVLLNHNTSAELLEAKLPNLMWDKMNSWLEPHGYEAVVSLQPLSDIHLYYNEENPNILTNIMVFSIVAFLVLLIATVNFINLSVSGSMKRIKEVSVRKVLGSSRLELVNRYISESFIVTFISFIIALFMIELILPYYNNIMSSFISLSDVLDGNIIAGVITLLIFISVISGAYPAFYLSSLEVANIYRGGNTKSPNNKLLKNSLIVFQFVISIGLIVSTVLISKQLNFIKTKNLGFEKENIIVFDLPDANSKKSCERIKEGLNKYSDIVLATASSQVPYNGFTSNGYIPKGHEDFMLIHILFSDNDFLGTYGLKVINGRGFNKEYNTNEEVYLINESLANYLEWLDISDKTIYRNDDHKVIGVVKNFNYASLHSEVEPLIISNKPETGLYDKLSVKVRTNDIQGTIERILAEITLYSDLDEVEYSFLDEKLQRVYLSEQRFRELFTFYSSAAIVMSIVGLISLVALATDKRSKEIGVRKVLGSSTTGLVYILTKEYGMLIITANLISYPVVYYLMNMWLVNFAYRVEVTVWIFMLGGLLTSFGAMLTVILQAIKYSRTNPVEVLRNE